jgi:5'(3')-deoxyribonucleotidase
MVREITAEWKGCKTSELVPEVDRDLRKWGIPRQEVYNELHKFAVTKKDLYRSVKPFSGAREYIQKLKELNYRIRLMTYRLFIPEIHRVTVEQTIEWLDQNKILYDDLCFIRDKQDVHADIYIEDDPKSINSLRKAGKHTICFTNCRNSRCKQPKAGSWAEIYELITQVG